MKPKQLLIPRLVLGVALASIFAFTSAQAQWLAPNQTQGFSNGKLVKFTYQENFDCVDQPFDDLDYNHMAAQSDSGEMQTPICQAVSSPRSTRRKKMQGAPPSCTYGPDVLGQRRPASR